MLKYVFQIYEVEYYNNDTRSDYVCIPLHLLCMFCSKNQYKAVLFCVIIIVFKIMHCV